MGLRFEQSNHILHRNIGSYQPIPAFQLIRVASSNGCISLSLYLSGHVLVQPSKYLVPISSQFYTLLSLSTLLMVGDLESKRVHAANLLSALRIMSEVYLLWGSHRILSFCSRDLIKSSISSNNTESKYGRTLPSLFLPSIPQFYFSTVQGKQDSASPSFCGQIAATFQITEKTRVLQSLKLWLHSRPLKKRGSCSPWLFYHECQQNLSCKNSSPVHTGLVARIPPPAPQGDP